MYETATVKIYAEIKHFEIRTNLCSPQMARGMVLWTNAIFMFNEIKTR